MLMLLQSLVEVTEAQKNNVEKKKQSKHTIFEKDGNIKSVLFDTEVLFALCTSQGFFLPHWITLDDVFMYTLNILLFFTGTNTPLSCCPG